MNFPYITNFNFNTIENFEGPRPKYCEFRDYGFKRVDNEIEFYANFLACPCIYYVKKDNLFCFSFEVNNVVNFAKENNIELTDTYDNFKLLNDNVNAHVKSSVKKRYQYNVSFIEKWKKVTIDSLGNFKIEKNTLEPFTLDIKDNFNEFKKFIIKYKNLITKLANDGIFLPTLTAGMDTRGLSGLYRHVIDKLPGYYLTEVKQDDKKHYEQGKTELAIAEQLARKIGIKLNRIEDLKGENSHLVTLCGLFNENAIGLKTPNDPEYIYKFIQHGWGDKNTYGNKLMPFIDDDYLKFKQEGETFRILLLLVLAPDLLNIPFLSGTSMHNRYSNGVALYPNFKTWIDYVKTEILDYWGQDNIDNLLKDNS